MQPWRPPFHASPAAHKGPISSKRVSSEDPLLRKFGNFSLNSLNFHPNFSSQAPIFGNFQLTSPQILKFSTHKPPFSEANVSSQAPHFGNPGHTPLPEKKLSAPRGSTCYLHAQTNQSGLSSPGREVLLSLTRYMYMCLPFVVLFMNYGIAMGGLLSQTNASHVGILEILLDFSRRQGVIDQVRSLFCETKPKKKTTTNFHEFSTRTLRKVALSTPLLTKKHNYAQLHAMSPGGATCIQRWISCSSIKTRKKGRFSRRGTCRAARV